MARRIKSKRGNSARAKKAAATRKANQRRARAAVRARDDKRGAELSRIEKLLGEDFETLAEARRALKAETSVPPPSEVDIDSADEYDRLYDDWEDVGIDFEDQGEIDAGVDY